MKETNLWVCPVCGGPTDTYRHPWAKVWCPSCGYVLREEGDRSFEHRGSDIEKYPLTKVEKCDTL